jgi:hypothetical protein
MKLRTLMTVLGTAAATVAVTLSFAAVYGDNTAQAAPTVKPLIAQSQFTSQGCTFTLKTDKPAYEQDTSPAIEVTATNPTKQPVKASVWVTVTSTSPMSRMSRMLPRPTTLWAHEYEFSLEPGQTKSLSATCTAKLPAGHEIRILLTDKKTAVVATNFAPHTADANAAPVKPNVNNNK